MSTVNEACSEVAQSNTFKVPKTVCLYIFHHWSIIYQNLLSVPTHPDIVLNEKH